MGALRSMLFRVVVTEGRAKRSRLLLASLGSSALLSLACSDGALVTDLLEPDAPAFAVADAARGFRDGFYWLPPMVKDPVTSGTFDAALSPVVAICALDGDSCDSGQDLVETFSTEGSGSTQVRVNADAEHYVADWHVDEYDLTASTRYRISVFADRDVLLGYADVEPVSNGGELKNVDTGEYIGLVDNRTLPIKFRIETGFVARLDIEPGNATITVGQTQQFTGTVTDLHGNVLSVPVTWTTGDDGVANMDGSGLATGVGPGSTAITGTVDGLSTSVMLTVEPEGGEVGWAQMSVGGDHACGVSTNGDTFCWGRGDLGQLGNGETGNRLTPEPIADGYVFVSMDAGLAHTCGLTADGAALCWGLNSTGQLGNGGTDNQLSPTAVAGNYRFATISTGYFHTCGLTAEGTALCWGLNSTGQLGNGGTDDQSSPVAVGGNHRFASIATGGYHTCAVTADGDAYCWGDRFFGALGDGDGSGSGQELLPIAVSGNHSFASIGASQLTTCGVTTEAVAFCWGDGSHGRLGNGGNGIVQGPTAVLGDHTFASVSPGRAHTCGVTTDGAAFCWGVGSLGMLGNGGTAEQFTPVAVAGNHVFASVGASENFHTCGLTAAGEAYCWGRGNYGQLGNGQTANQLVPVRVSDPF
jgi:alpha-tubulin suppressor-like RCC1 family protein